MTPVTVSRNIEEKCSKPTPVTLSFRFVTSFNGEFDIPRKFRRQLIEEGWFERNWLWDSVYISLITILCAVGTYISHSNPIIAAILIGIGMQQAGFKFP